MRALLKRLLPSPARRWLRARAKTVRYALRRVAIARAVRRGRPLRIIVGAAETWQAGWYATNEQWLDITKGSDWQAVFGGRKLLTHVVAEHVMEHLSEPECAAALGHIAAHMVAGGRIRIAVPDGRNPNPDYLRHVGIGGIGDDAADHKQFLDITSLTQLLRQAGFVPEQVEGYDESGRLVQKRWAAEDGFIRRSRQNPGAGRWDFVDASTSLIVDGIKTDAVARPAPF